MPPSPFRVRLPSRPAGLSVVALVCGLCLHFEEAEAQTSSGIVETRIRGDVRVIQPMTDGSFVLGGYTSYFNGARDPQLFRVLPNGTRIAFPVEANGPVLALAVSGPWLYLGGDFQVVNGISLPFAARVNAITGAVDPVWRPAPNGDLLDLVPVAGGVVLNGSFSRVGGLPRSRLAMVSDVGAGLPLETWRCDAGDQVDRLVAHQSWLYAAGRFRSIGGFNLSFLVRLNPATGAVDASWNPAPNNPVFDVAGNATHLYCAGGFTRMGNANVPFLVRIPLGSANADTLWFPGPDSLCARVCVSGDSVYASGNFTSISSVPRSYLARIPTASGAADAGWNPPVDGGLLALVPDGSNGFWGGGRFDSGIAGGSGFAHFTKTQGTAAPTYPATVENIGAVTVIRPLPAPGGWLVGGDFDTVNGLGRHAVFRLNPDRTLNAAWNAGLRGLYPQAHALDVLPEDGGTATFLVGGQFEVPGVGLSLLYNLMKLRVDTGAAVTAFNPQPSGVVRAIVPEGPSSWLVGGDFEVIGMRNQAYVARIGANGSADPIFAPEPNGPVHAILKQDDDIYLGGEFTGFFDAATLMPVPYLARLTAVAPIPDLGWRPQPNQAVFALASAGNFLYAGGRFDNMARERRRYVAQIPLGGAGTATAWNPAPGGIVHSLKIDGGHLYVGGEFFTIANFVWPKLARFNLGGLTLDTGFQTTGENGSVYAIEPQAGADLFVGGSFNGWDDDFSKRSLIRITAGAGSPPPALALPPPTELPDLLADFFAAGGSIVPLSAAEGAGLAWEENPVLPSGMVARVQWSTDMTEWRESGQEAGGVTRVMSIEAEGTRRIARVVTEPANAPDARLYLRVLVTAGENAPSRLPQ